MSDGDQDNYDTHCAYTIFLTLYYYSGIYIILYSGYIEEWPHEYKILSSFIMTFFNVVTGGLGDILQISNYKFTSENCCCKCVQSFFIILYSIIGIAIQFYAIFFYMFILVI